MADPFLGQINQMGFGYAPRGYNECNGNLMQISGNTALFSLLGTTYGGDGRTTYALPDLRGRCPIHHGTGPGLPTIRWGQRGGDVSVTLTAAELPSHTHALQASSADGNSTSPAGRILAAAGAAGFTGQVPAGIPVTGTTTIQGRSGNLTNGQTSESRDITGTVSPLPYANMAPDTAMSPLAVGNTGGSQSFYTMSPFLGIIFAMAVTGAYPSRN